MSYVFPPTPDVSERGAKLWSILLAVLEDGHPRLLERALDEMEAAGASRTSANSMISNARKRGWIEFSNTGPRNAPLWSIRLSLHECLHCGAPRSPYAPPVASPASVDARPAKARQRGAGGRDGASAPETEAEKIDRWMREEGLDPNE